MTKTHSFADSLKLGHRGEEMLVNAYPDHLERLDGRGADLRIKSSGQTIEVKSMFDFHYGPEIIRENKKVVVTNAFFVERWSCRELRTSGGPYAARDKGVDFDSYFFPLDGLWFIYPTAEFLQMTKDSLSQGGIQSRSVPNYTQYGGEYTTWGLIVPIAWYEPILVKRIAVPSPR